MHNFHPDISAFSATVIHGASALRAKQHSPNGILDARTVRPYSYLYSLRLCA